MTKPSWHDIEVVTVPAKPAGFWTPVVDYIIGPRLLRLQVVAEIEGPDKKKTTVPTTWTLNRTSCSAHGLVDDPPTSGLLLPTALRGALIGKIGGSSADLPELPTGALPNTPIGTVYPGRRAFIVGSYCVIRLSADDSGQLFLTANDTPKEMVAHAGELRVRIEEASL